MDKEYRRSLLIVYDYFYPGYKAGGPIQSLTNLVVALQNNYAISVITSVYDLQSDQPYEGITVNSWNNIILPGSASPVKVWYADKKLTLGVYKEIFRDGKPDLIYLNGLYSYHFFIMPQLVLRRLKVKPKLVICPRGMLQEGALGGKSLKKKVYFGMVNISRLLKDVHWHATNQEELKDIKRLFGQKQEVIIASNIPKPPLRAIEFPEKQTGKLRLVYLSLIAEKKNLLFLLEILQQSDNISLDIYGPVKDTAYWEKCKTLMAQMTQRVVYKGGIAPAKVQQTFSEYDASVLLTKGENFGHALYESLSAGRPLITSNFTPWINLQQQKAGWNIDISAVTEGVTLLNDLCKMPADLFNEYCTGAYKLAEKYYKALNSLEEYKKLFNPERK